MLAFFHDFSESKSIILVKQAEWKAKEEVEAKAKAEAEAKAKEEAEAKQAAKGMTHLTF